MLKKTDSGWMRRAVWIAGLTALGAHAALVDTGDGRHWHQALTSPIVLTWKEDWFASTADTVTLTMRGTFLNQTVTLSAATREYAWTPVFDQVQEDLCTVSITFKDGIGNVLGAFTNTMAVAADAFQSDSVLHDMTAPEWLNISGMALIPWDANWATDADAHTATVLSWSNAQTGSITNDSPFGYYPLNVFRHPPGHYDFTLAFLNAASENIDPPLTGSARLLSRGLLITIR